MTKTIPTLDEIRGENDPIRRSILEAILRMAEKRPLHVKVSRTSVVALSEEAQIKRHYLNRLHKDLKERYLFIKDHFLESPELDDERERFTKLNSRIGKLEERLRNVTQDRDNWKTSANIFVRAMTVQEVGLAKRDTELARLRKKLEEARADGNLDELAARRHRRIDPPNIG